LYVGQDIEEFGPWSGLPLLVLVVVVVVVGAIGPGMIVGGTYCHPKCLLLLLFPCKRSGHLLLN